MPVKTIGQNQTLIKRQCPMTEPENDPCIIVDHDVLSSHVQSPKNRLVDESRCIRVYSVYVCFCISIRSCLHTYVLSFGVKRYRFPLCMSSFTMSFVLIFPALEFQLSKIMIIMIIIMRAYVVIAFVSFNRGSTEKFTAAVVTKLFPPYGTVCLSSA